jgi:hypothetical protein
MVAQVNNETFARAMSPCPDSSDSEDVIVALETARTLEARGDIQEAIRWLRRAADEAEKDGNDLRVVAIARAAADLTTAIDLRRSSIESPSPKLAARALSSPPSSLPAPPAKVPSLGPTSKQVSSLPPRPAQGSSTPPPLPARVSSPPALPVRLAPPPSSPTGSLPPPRKVSSDPPSASPSTAITLRLVPVASPSPSEAVDERAVDRTPIRVAVTRSAINDGLFVVRRLRPGQPLPIGTSEATLVFGAFASSSPGD